MYSESIFSNDKQAVLHSCCQ